MIPGTSLREPLPLVVFVLLAGHYFYGYQWWGNTEPRVNQCNGDHATGDGYVGFIQQHYSFHYAGGTIMRERFVVALLFVVAGLVTASLATNACGQAPAELAHFQSNFSDFTPRSVQDFADFPLYSAGPAFGELPLTYITRVSATPQLSAVGGAAGKLPDNRTNYVNFIYGTCDSRAGEGGCAPPLTVQVWPACDRTLQDYDYNMPEGVPSREYERMTIRGVPAARFSDMLEIYTGSVTIVIFGDTPDLRAGAAENLISANNLADAVSAGDSLPPPVPGAMEGELHC